MTLDTHIPLDAEFRLGVRATQLDPGRRVVTLTSGEDVPYHGLIIATGVAARQLGDPSLNDTRVVTLRTIDDACRLDERLSDAQHIAILGGGFIGCEVASTARARALDVTIIDQSPLLLGRVLGPVLATHVTELHRCHGVDLRLGTGVERWETAKRGISAHLRDGEVVRADALIVGIGSVPRVEWLAGLGLDLSDGVLCDAKEPRG